MNMKQSNVVKVAAITIDLHIQWINNNLPKVKTALTEFISLNQNLSKKHLKV